MSDIQNVWVRQPLDGQVMSQEEFERTQAATISAKIASLASENVNAKAEAVYADAEDVRTKRREIQALYDSLVLNSEALAAAVAETVKNAQSTAADREALNAAVSEARIIAAAAAEAVSTNLRAAVALDRQRAEEAKDIAVASAAEALEHAQAVNPEEINTRFQSIETNISGLSNDKASKQALADGLAAKASNQALTDGLAAKASNQALADGLAAKADAAAVPVAATVAEVRAGAVAGKFIPPSVMKDALVPVAFVAGAALNFSSGFNFSTTLAAGATTVPAPTNLIEGRGGTIFIKQPSSGSAATLSWNVAYDFGKAGLPTLAVGASKEDVIPYVIRDGKVLLGFRGAL